MILGFVVGVVVTWAYLRIKVVNAADIIQARHNQEIEKLHDRIAVLTENQRD